MTLSDGKLKIRQLRLRLSHWAFVCIQLPLAAAHTKLLCVYQELPYLKIVTGVAAIQTHTDESTVTLELYERSYSLAAQV